MKENTKSDKTLQNSTKNKAIKLLSSGMSKTDVANQLGVSRDVIYNWLKDAKFRDAINIEIDTSTKLLSIELAKLDIKATQAIARALDSDNASLALKAALGFIEVRKNLSQIDNICGRIEQLEEVITPKHIVVDNTNRELAENAKKCINAVMT